VQDHIEFVALRPAQPFQIACGSPVGGSAQGQVRTDISEGAAAEDMHLLVHLSPHALSSSQVVQPPRACSPPLAVHPLEALAPPAGRPPLRSPASRSVCPSCRRSKDTAGELLVGQASSLIRGRLVLVIVAATTQAAPRSTGRDSGGGQG